MPIETSSNENEPLYIDLYKAYTDSGLMYLLLQDVEKTVYFNSDSIAVLVSYCLAEEYITSKGQSPDILGSLQFFQFILLFITLYAWDNNLSNLGKLPLTDFFSIVVRNHIVHDLRYLLGKLKYRYSISPSRDKENYLPTLTIYRDFPKPYSQSDSH